MTALSDDELEESKSHEAHDAAPPSRSNGSRKPPIAIRRGTPEKTTDVGNARRLVGQHGKDFRYVPKWGKWLTWDGRCWIVDENGVRMQAHAKATARAIYSEAGREGDDELRSKLAKWAPKSETKGAIEAMIALAKSEPGISVTHEALDRDPWLLNVRNGTIDLRTGELLAHRREDLITKVAPVIYDPETATCPTWDAFVLRAMGGNVELVGYLARVVGYALTGSTREHALFFSHGDGSNGKSTFHNALHEALGDYATRAPRGLLFRPRGGGERHSTELTTLFGARFVSCAEIEDDATFDEGLVKDLTGGDPITARRMREDDWTFNPTHKLFVPGNHKPKVKGTDEGIWRRIRLIPWTVTIAPRDRDKELAEKLSRERHGIIAWAVRGCLEWQRDGLGDPPAVVAATAAYRKESDALAEFFDRRCVFGPEAKSARRHVRVAYEEWAAENGAQPIGAKRFAARLRARGVDDGGTIRAGARMLDAWRGVDLRAEHNRTLDDGVQGRRDL